jgi:hypothetical protein
MSTKPSNTVHSGPQREDVKCPSHDAIPEEPETVSMHAIDAIIVLSYFAVATFLFGTERFALSNRHSRTPSDAR